MKSFVAACAIFLVFIGLTVGNAIYVHRVSETLCEGLSTLSPESAVEEIEDLMAYWERHRPLIALSIGHRELDHLSESLLTLRVAHGTSNTENFEQARALARSAAELLARPERFSLENLL